jgi:hypothetical protein
MTEQQKIHIAMLNSYNVITEAFTIDEIMDSGVPLFSHIPDEEISIEALNFIMYYFQQQEMYEHCLAISEYMSKNFNEDGTSKIESCGCEYPEISEYTKKMKCAKCNKRLIK